MTEKQVTNWGCLTGQLVPKQSVSAGTGRPGGLENRGPVERETSLSGGGFSSRKRHALPHLSALQAPFQGMVQQKRWLSWNGFIIQQQTNSAEHH